MVVVVAVVKLLAVEDNQGAAVDQTGVAKRLIVVCIGWKKDWEQLKIIESRVVVEVKLERRHLDFICCIVDLKTMLERVLSPLVDAFVLYCMLPLSLSVTNPHRCIQCTGIATTVPFLQNC